MTFANATPCAVLAVPTTAPDGRDVVVAIVKATFARRRDGRLVLADQQRPVRASDVPWFPDAPASSIRYPGDICVEKRGTDVVVVGEAVARAPAPAVDVAVQVRDRKALLRVHGERLYYRHLFSVVVGPASPFDRKPIVYERAYGGSSPDQSLMERRNPVGRGVAKDPGSLVDTPAPQIEHPSYPITSAADRPEPVGLGAIASHWLPRCDYAGTFDAAWFGTRMPLMPADFDSRFNNVAHPSLQFEEALSPGDPIVILGMTEEGLWNVELPFVPFALRACFHDGRKITLRPRADTVLIEPGKNELELTFRQAFPTGRGRSVLREIRIDVADEPLPEDLTS